MYISYYNLFLMCFCRAYANMQMYVRVCANVLINHTTFLRKFSWNAKLCN